MPTSRRDIIKGRLATARKWLDSVTVRLTPDLMDWAPAEGMRTVGGQLAEIVSVELPLVPFMKNGVAMTDAEMNAVVGDWDDLENMKQKLVDIRNSTLLYLASLSEAELDAPSTVSEDWYGCFWQPGEPRAEHFVNIAEHEYYHAGQLISYMWFRGDDPYRW
ncbi:MAG: DinB family protein [Armatimonadetes bacterium]|nr:DinB family protein [Armatimonadota bacterium]MDE2205194.1 DinB family protein [Armatimonadota bacterium]